MRTLPQEEQDRYKETMSKIRTQIEDLDHIPQLKNIDKLPEKLRKKFSHYLQTQENLEIGVEKSVRKDRFHRG